MSYDNLQISPVNDLPNIFIIYLQLVLENSAGEMKVKVVEYGADKSLEDLYMPSIVHILESEPLISVSI